MIKTELIGNIGKDVEQRTTKDGKIIFVFSVGIYKGKDKTQWIDVLIDEGYGNKLKQWLLKGVKVWIYGNPEVNAYINKENKPVATLTLFAHSIEILTPKNAGNNDPYGIGKTAKPHEVPF